MQSIQTQQNLLHNQEQYINTISNLEKELLKVSPKLNKIKKLQTSIFKIQKVLIDANQKLIVKYSDTFKDNIPDHKFLLTELQQLTQIAENNNKFEAILKEDSNVTDLVNTIHTEFIANYEDLQHKKGRDFLNIWKDAEKTNLEVSDAFDILNDVIIPKIEKNVFIELTQRQSILDQQIEDIFFLLDSLIAQSKAMISYRYKDE